MGLPRSVTRWAPAVERSLRQWHRRFRVPYRAADSRQALRIMYRESRGDPRAVNRSSGAAGLFQWLPGWWRSKGYPILSARWNIGMMAQYHASREAAGRDPWAPWAL